jgi:hypothetical protein
MEGESASQFVRNAVRRELKRRGISVPAAFAPWHRKPASELAGTRSAAA